MTTPQKPFPAHASSRTPTQTVVFTNPKLLAAAAAAANAHGGYYLTGGFWRVDCIVVFIDHNMQTASLCYIPAQDYVFPKCIYE